jgi:hypothetical protein
MKTIEQQQSILKNRLSPVFLGILVTYLGASVVAEKGLRVYLASLGLNPAEPWVQNALMPLILCLPLAGVYFLIYWLVCLRCPGCQVTVRRPSYHALARLKHCPGCGCQWSAEGTPTTCTADDEPV